MGQSFSPKQKAFLDSLFASAGEGAIPGSWMADNSLAEIKLEATVIAKLNAPEADPIFSASVAAGITNTNTSQWNSAYSWGNHALAGYLTSGSLAPYATQAFVTSQGYLTATTTPKLYGEAFTASPGAGAKTFNLARTPQTGSSVIVSVAGVVTANTWAGVVVSVTVPAGGEAILIYYLS